MTNEKIIANIERYISTVSKEQQQHFEQALEIAEKEHITDDDRRERYRYL